MNKKFIQGLLMVLASLQISNAQIVERDTVFDKFYEELDNYNRAQLQEYTRIELSAIAEKIGSDFESYEIKHDLKYVQELLLYYEKRFGRDVVYHFLSGGVYYYDRKYDKAIEEFSKSIVLDPVHLESIEMRAYSKMRLHDYYGAIGDINKAIKLVDDDYGNLAYLYGELGLAQISIARLEEEIEFYILQAIDSFDNAIKLDKNQGYYYYQKGVCLGILGRNGDACLTLSRAGELGYSKAYDAIKIHCSP